MDSLIHSSGSQYVAADKIAVSVPYEADMTKACASEFAIWLSD
jgi:hypothetical protein